MIMKSQSISRAVVVIIASIVLSGCAAFRSGEAKPLEPWSAPTQRGSQSISLVITGEAVVNGALQDAPQRMIQAWQEEAKRAYEDSGVFSYVQVGAGDTDLRAEVHIVDRGEASMGLAMLSGLTLMLLPANGYDELTVSVTFKDRAGTPIGTYEKKERITFWIELFLVFVTPFKSPNSVARATLYDLNRATIDQARTAGMLHAWNSGRASERTSLKRTALPPSAFTCAARRVRA